MTEVAVLDTEGAVRLWLRTNPFTQPVLGDRVYFGYPTTSQAGAFATVSRVGGGPLRGEVPMDRPRISVSVWAGQKKQASDGAVAVANAFASLDNELLPGDVYVYGASVETVLWSPEPPPGNTPRYIVDALVTTRGATVEEEE